MTISATICAPGGAAYHLVLTPANAQGADVIAAEIKRAQAAISAGADDRIELSNIAPGFFKAQHELGSLEELLKDAPADALLEDAVYTLYQLEHNASALPEADIKLLGHWLAQLGQLSLDLLQTRRYADLLTVAQKYFVEGAA